MAWIAVAGLLAMAGAGLAAELTPPASDFPIVDYQLLSKTPAASDGPANNPLYDYVYRVTVRNAGSVAGDLKGKVATKLGSVSMVDADAAFGQVPVGQSKASIDTVAVRANKNFDRRLDPKSLKNGRWVYDEEGRDEGDDHVPGLPRRVDDWSDSVIKSYYDLKFQHFFQWSFVLQTDVAGPDVSGLMPADNSSLAADAIPTIGAQYTDSVSGVDPASTKLELDGQDVTAQAQVTATGINFTPVQALAERTHTVKLTVADRSGNTTVQAWGFKTATPPAITRQSPKDIFLPSGAAPVIGASFGDIGSGIEASTIKLLVNGADVTAQATVTATDVGYAVTSALGDGIHNVRLIVADKAGNFSESTWTFGVVNPPTITALTPKDVVVPAGSRPTIAAAFSDTRVGIDLVNTKLVVDGIDVTGLSQVAETGISYVPTQPLAEGPHAVFLKVVNKTNAAAEAVWGFEVDALKSYSVSILSPMEPQSVPTPQITVTAIATANRSSPDRLTLNGGAMSAIGANAEGAVVYSGNASLIDGTNTLTVEATFGDGEVRSTSTQVNYDAPAVITITSPADRATLGPASVTSPRDLTGVVERPVLITGRASKPVTSVTINQQGATLAAGGTEFSFPNFFLHEGSNLLTAVATDSKGRVSSAAINVSVDQTAPIINVEYPRNGYTTRKAWIDVRGMVNDAVEGMFGAPEPQLTVNGVAAQVADRYFQATEIPLKQGINTLTVRATDQVGNAREQTLQVMRADLGLAGLILESGHNQTGPANTELPQPLSVLALNDKGEPAADLLVNFEVLRGTGSVSATQRGSAGSAPYSSRTIQVRTDANGRAQAWYTVGKLSGPGANAVRASALGYAEDAHFTANALRGPVERINADFGTNQISETGAPVMEILSAVVRDAGNNPLPNVAVRFRVEEGQARFTDAPGASVSADGQFITVFTDKNGVVAVRPTLGSTPGIVKVAAAALKVPGGSFDAAGSTVSGAHYIIRAKVPQDGPARFIGTLYTDKGDPLAGARISIGRTALQATTDVKGYFELTDVPPGRIDLFVDGRTVNPNNDPSRPQYPSLHFESYVVRGQVNQLPHPIYLPPLLTSGAKTVGGNEDVILTLPGLEGFQMKVKANSVTFPDGSKVGTLVVSPVAADRLPMAPPAGGAQFGVPAWTIQPAGARFDPPIEVQMPNSTNEIPGDNLPVVQWDHDLGQYVPMGRATVSSDGAYLITDAGSGVTKAGWGGLCRYDPPKCAQSHPPELTSAKIIVQGWQEADDVVEPVGRTIQFKAEAQYRNCTPSYEWQIDGVGKQGQSVSHIFANPKKALVSLTVKCKATCEDAGDPSPVSKVRDLYAAKVTFEEAWSNQFPGAEANGWSVAGNRTGPVDKPYALMGVRNDDTGHVRVKYRLEPPEQAVKDRLKFGLVVNGQVTGDSGACPNATGPVSNTEACLKLNSPSIVDVFPAWGFDRNNDGRIASDERPGDSTGERMDWKFRMVSQASYQQAVADYNAGAATFGPLAQEWLNAFRDGYLPGGAIGGSYSISFADQPGLTHANGAIPQPGRLGISKTATHQPGSSVVGAILDSPAFYGWIFNALQVKAREIDTKIGAQSGRVQVQLAFSNAEPEIGKVTTVRSGTSGVNFADLYAILGDGQLSEVKLLLTVSRHPLDPNSIVVFEAEVMDGRIEDLFDFDYDVSAGPFKTSFSWFFPRNLGPLAKAGAMFQAVHGTIGRAGGQVFKNIYLLGSGRKYSGRTVQVR